MINDINPVNEQFSKLRDMIEKSVTESGRKLVSFDGMQATEGRGGLVFCM